MNNRIFVILSCSFFLLFLVALIAPAFQAKRVPATVSPDVKHLRQLSVALLNYEAVNGSLPPATIKDPKSGILRSWRVEILPYLDCELLYRQYKVDEPWDGPTNSKLWGQMPDCFAYADRGQHTAQYVGDYPEGETNYVAIIGDTTLWPFDGHKKSTRRRRRSDSPVLLLGVEQTGIKWTEPRDVSTEEATRMLSSPENYPKSFFKDEFLRIRQTIYNCQCSTPVCLSDGSSRHVGKLTENSAISFLSGNLDWDSLEYRKSNSDSNSFIVLETRSYFKWPRVLVGCLVGVCLLLLLGKLCLSTIKPFRKMKNYISKCASTLDGMNSL